MRPRAAERSLPRPGPPDLARRLPPSFYARPVLEVAREMIGCVVAHGETAGVIVETEAYHHSEPACHAFVGLTARTRTLFGPPGQAYVYRSYGIHALLNAVCEPAGIGAAVLIRALRPVAGLEQMRFRRGVEDDLELCSGPGKLTQALGVELGENGSSLLDGPVAIFAGAGGPGAEAVPGPGAEPVPGPGAEPVPGPGAEPVEVRSGPRIGISKAVELPWRFCLAGSPYVSRPRLS
jgi:DNA-3-methyladenine glycosylase